MELKGYLYARFHDGIDAPDIDFFKSYGEQIPIPYLIDQGYIPVMPATIQYECNFDFKASRVHALNAQKRAIVNEYTAKLAEVNEQISKYTAIEAPAFHPIEPQDDSEHI
jgi:hypothetical protein